MPVDHLHHAKIHLGLAVLYKTLGAFEPALSAIFTAEQHIRRIADARQYLAMELARQRAERAVFLPEARGDDKR